MSHKTKANLIFAVLAVYIIIQFLWWTYLLLSLNTDYYFLKNELHLAWGVAGQTDLDAELAKKRAMIIGEGLIFLLLLILGIIFTARYMKRDAERARLQHNFLLSITHELKTPVASAQLYLQTLQQRKIKPEQQYEFIGRALASNKRLAQLVDKLLLATQLEHAGIDMSRETIMLRPLVSSCIDVIKSLNKNDHRFDFRCNVEPLIAGDKVSLETIFLNLLENAVKYAPKNSPIVVGMEQQGDFVVVQVINEGHIPSEDHKRIFDKFFRSGNEETRSAKGTGVGLYLVKSLTQLHSGKVNVKVAEGKVQFTVRLPQK